MRISPHFHLEELTHTRYATLDNTPDGAALDNLDMLAQFLEKVRAALGNPVIVTSGYRSFAINLAAGGAKNSAHLYGLAADFICPGHGTPYQACRAIIAADLDFDQMIHEPGWVHIAIPAPGTEPRGEVLTRMSDGRYVLGLHDREVFHA